MSSNGGTNSDKVYIYFTMKLHSHQLEIWLSCVLWWELLKISSKVDLIYILNFTENIHIAFIMFIFIFFSWGKERKDKAEHCISKKQNPIWNPRIKWKTKTKKRNDTKTKRWIIKSRRTYKHRRTGRGCDIM